MKVRWNKNSLRLRITPPELAALEQGDSVREEIRFPGSATMGWSVVIEPGSPGTSLVQRGCSVMLLLGDTDLARLGAPESEGVYFTANPADGIDVDNRGTFHYYVEKDFPCIHPRAGDVLEEETETFPTPLNYGERK